MTIPSSLVRPLCLTSLLVLAASPLLAGDAYQSELMTVEVRKNIRVVYDIKTAEIQAGIGKALYYLRGLYEAYRKQGVPADQVHVSAVLHGPTVAWLLKDETYQDQVGDPFAVNLNHKVIEELIELGASVEACNVTMKGYGWTAEDLLPGVRVVHDGYTRMIDLQQRGYAYIRF